MSDIYTIAGNDVHNLVSAVAGQYSTIRQMELRFMDTAPGNGTPATAVMSVRINGQGTWHGPFSAQHTAPNADPVARLQELIAEHSAAGTLTVGRRAEMLVEIMELLPRAYEQLTG